MALITLIAANLDYFSDLAKNLWLTNIACGDSGIRYFITFILESRRQAKEKIKVEDI